MADFNQSLLAKINEIGDFALIIEVRLNSAKQVFSMLMTPEGKALLTRSDNFRTIFNGKVNDWINDARFETKTQFLAMARSILIVTANIELGKNL